jgi:dTDP-D-glucose 4,6-dehydratase
MPRPVLRLASGLDRLFRRGKAKLTRDRVGLYCHPDWTVAAEKRPPRRLWQPGIKTATGLRETADWYREQGWLK